VHQPQEEAVAGEGLDQKGDMEADCETRLPLAQRKKRQAAARRMKGKVQAALKADNT
jgi:hypothetical protein